VAIVTAAEQSLAPVSAGAATTGKEGSARATAPRPTRSWADWAGFTAFMLCAGWLLRGPRSLGIFLVVPVLYEMGTAATFLLRGRPQRSSPALLPRLVAYGSAFLIPVFARWALRWHPALVAGTTERAVQVAGASLWLCGLVLGFWPLWHLRTAFSVEPAARQLVTAGPYQIARHPIYASYLLTFTGFLLLHLTVPMALVTGLWFFLTGVRMRYEEQVLTATFPEYRSYREQVGALGPRLWRRHGSASAATEAVAR